MLATMRLFFLILSHGYDSWEIQRNCMKMKLVNVNIFYKQPPLSKNSQHDLEDGFPVYLESHFTTTLTWYLSLDY